MTMTETRDAKEVELLENALKEDNSSKKLVELNMEEDVNAVEVPFKEFKEQAFNHMELMIDVDELEDAILDWYERVPRTEAVKELHESFITEIGLRFSDLRKTINDVYRISIGCDIDAYGNLIKGIKIVGGEDE
jgi:hypothetical protein